MITFNSLSETNTISIRNEESFPNNPIHTQIISLDKQLYIYLNMLNKQGWFHLTDENNKQFNATDKYQLVIDFDIGDISLILNKIDKEISEYTIDIINDRVYITFPNILETRHSMKNINIFDYINKRLTILLSPFEGRYNRNVIYDEINQQVIEANINNLSVYDSDKIFFGKMDIDVLGTLKSYGDINKLDNNIKHTIYHNGNDGCKSGLNASHLGGLLSNNFSDIKHEHKEYLQLSHNSYSSSHQNIRNLIKEKKCFLEKPSILGFKRNKSCSYSYIDSDLNIFNKKSKLLSTKFSTIMFKGMYSHSEWQISDNSYFNDCITEISETSDSLYIDENIFESGLYFARVKHHSNEISSEWSNIYSFEMTTKVILNPKILECSTIGKKLYVSVDDFEIEYGLEDKHKYTKWFLYDQFNRQIWTDSSIKNLLDIEIEFDFDISTTYYVGAQFCGNEYESDITKYKFSTSSIFPISISMGVMDGFSHYIRGDYVIQSGEPLREGGPTIVNVFKYDSLSLVKITEIEIGKDDGYFDFVSTLLITEELDIIIVVSPIIKVLYEEYLPYPDNISDFTEEYGSKVLIYKKIQGFDRWEYNSTITQPTNTGFNMLFGSFSGSIDVSNKGNRIAIASTYFSDNFLHSCPEPYQPKDYKKMFYIFEKNEYDEWINVFEYNVEISNKPLSIEIDDLFEAIREDNNPMKLKFSKDGKSLICSTTYSFLDDMPLLNDNILLIKRRNNGLWTKELNCDYSNNPNIPSESYHNDLLVGYGFSIVENGNQFFYTIHDFENAITKIIVRTFDGFIWINNTIEQLLNTFVIDMTIYDNHLVLFVSNGDTKTFSIKYYTLEENLKDAYKLVCEHTIIPSLFYADHSYFVENQLVISTADEFEILK